MKSIRFEEPHVSLQFVGQVMFPYRLFDAESISAQTLQKCQDTPARKFSYSTPVGQAY